MKYKIHNFIEFYVDKNSENKSHVVLNEDNSFKTVNNSYWNFQISVEPFTVLLLNFNYETKECVGIEGYSCIGFKNCKKSKITFGKVCSGVLKVCEFVEEKDSYEIGYLFTNNEVHFDNDAKILAFGNVDGDGEIFQIGIGQYVKLKDKKLIAIYLKFVNP